MTRKIRRLLVANRGEIAARVARTAKARGLEVAVLRHSAEEEGPAHALADQVVTIEGAPPVAAYLDIPQIVAAADRAGADAVHPGYGFLSENAAFARALDTAGLIFVGPTAEVIDLMGDKVRARAFVAERGFPVAPSAIEDDDPASFIARARAVGYPLLIKPSAGGGGKGMRIVREDEVLAAEIETARREGQRYFGDGRLFVERYIERPRHIEVQVMGDGRGNVVHFWERECSIQRRFQKIVEESPSPGLLPEARAAMSRAAVALARQERYRSAGTIEFVLDDDTGAFYFLEMNTRIQVEHPVTEMLTGLDLVGMQLRLAMGEHFGAGLTQDHVTRNGHAIEVRICAENPDKMFLPSPGRITRLVLPEGEGVRVDTGVRDGDTVTPHYDSMIAKLIVHGPDREAAIARMGAALDGTVVEGITTNIAFLRRVMNHEAFRLGRTLTSFVDTYKTDLIG